ncbi:MAG: T9SS type A sorting domain-containing protein [Bacteroidetes bacterium]|nr:T9SS type A sorting domain-containing protein [Bacteroidota bacterium]
MNLSVINSPDSPGVACDFQPWSFYLGGKRTYWGLPNNPDYDLPALAGSPCDTLVGIGDVPVQEQQPNLYVYYSPQWQTAFINANQLKGTSGKLQVFDVIGNLVFEENTKFNPPYYTKNLNLTSLAKGMYVVTLEAGGQRLVKKFVVE